MSTGASATLEQLTSHAKHYVPQPPAFPRASSATVAVTVSTTPKGPNEALIGVADFFSSWAAFAFAMLFAHPVDTLRVRWQTRGLAPLTTIRRDGIRSLYGGLGTPLVMSAPLVASMFATNEFYKTKIAEITNDPALRSEDPKARKSLTTLFCAGALTGSTISFASCPLTLIRVQQQISGANGGATMSFPEVLRNVYRAGGVRNFYGAWPYEIIASSQSCMVYYAAYEIAKDAIRRVCPERYRDTPAMNFSAAVCTSFATWTTCLPTDLVRNKLQADTLSPVKQYPRGARDVIRNTYRGEGIRGFWRGLPLTLARSFFSTGITLPCFDLLKPHGRRLLCGRDV
eukprot:CAMPEP_0174835134 /NCGR_PEP_ID=MMETSP1114-20130205/5252_1 /TAXON_ID=312471 /ORGANISM="Neobodo designis, Strain CCAP 1951/1" /LENGTH=342 /DNA_ID=CAMNT_0016069079 /DNA_START=212 /DNA_END=1240 /DNA_ORIENTATION=-